MTTFRLLAVVALFASRAWSQAPVGVWQSPKSVTFTNPALAGSEFALEVEVGADGRFKGTWGQYLCTSFPGAYGVAIISCSRSDGGAARGVFTADGAGQIELGGLGRASLRWTSSTEELSIELPRDWQDAETPVLYRSKLKLGGSGGGARSKSSRKPQERLLSAVALYREFVANQDAALARHAGKTYSLEGLRGTFIRLSMGGAAIHVPDGTQPRALVLMFDDVDEAAALVEGAPFRFQCTVEAFDYGYLTMKDCVVAASP